MTNFRLFQTESLQTAFKFDEDSGKFSKQVVNTVEKEALLVMGNFSFSSCFQKICTADSRKTQGLFGKGSDLSSVKAFNLKKTEIESLSKTDSPCLGKSCRIV